MKLFSVSFLVLLMVAVAHCFSLRELYERMESAAHPEGHRITQKEAGFDQAFDEIGSVGNRFIIARQDGPHMFLDDNGIPVAQAL